MDCAPFWAQGGALPYCTRKPPFGDPVSHIAPSSGNAGRSPYPSVVFGLSMLVSCGKARVLGGAVPFYSRATAFCFSVVAKLSLALGPRVFSSTRSVHDLLKWFCRSNAIEQGAPRYSRTTCMLVVSCDMPALSTHFCTGVVLSFSRAKSFVAVWYGCALKCEAFYYAVHSSHAHSLLWLALYETRFC